MRLLSPLVSCLLAGRVTALVDLPKMSIVVEEALRSVDITVANLTAAPKTTPSTTMLTVAAKPTPALVAKAAAAGDPAYWLKDMPKQGRAAFNANPAGYKVWRNVKDYGAKGDGVTDDSDAINRAISDGNRCGPFTCQSASDSPAVVYFPAGTYLLSKKIVVYYMTQLIGNPNSLPVLKAASNLQAVGLIDGMPYSDQNGQPGWTSTNLFMRQIRNFQIDLTAIPPEQGATAIHWPAAQATSIQNVKIVMTPSRTSVQQGIFVENGSGGFMVDIEITGGQYGMNIGNQQFTMRNIKISNAIVGISQIWNWGWLYQGLTISNCDTAFSMNNGGTGNQLVGSVVIIDSTINNCPTFVDMAWTTGAVPRGAGQLILENIQLNGVGVAVKGTSGTVLAGGQNIVAWGQGNKYTPSGPQKFQGGFTASARPQGLLDGNSFYAKSKPQYENLGTDSFVSVRSCGASGDGVKDDTLAVQNAVLICAATKKILFFDQGVYKVTKTIYFPPGTRIVGETYPVIMASGSTWANKADSIPVIQIGKPGESGSIEWSDMIVATQGATPGAKVIEYNLNTTRGSGVWDVHTRIGGTKGTNLQVAQCPIYTQNPECMAASLNVHVTSSAQGAYFENNWFWTADHDFDDPNSTRVSVFTGRGLLVEGSNMWLYGSGVEHHGLYQYQFANARDVVAGFIQTETPYWQPSPDAKGQPYPLSSALNDPDYASACPSGTCDAYGLRILNSQNIHVYGAGLYSFFKNYDVSCSSDQAPGGQRDCQNQIFSIEGSSSGIQVFALSEVGALQMATIDRQDYASWSDNLSVYSNTIGLFTYKI